jgi:hypothetical protein
LDQIIDLVIPFIALAILSVGIDKLTLVLEGIMHKIPKLPDKFEWTIAYIIVLGISYLVCWQGDFKLFAYLNLNFKYEWEDWFLTALIISGGSAFVRTNFIMIDNIPSVIRGISTTLKQRLVSQNVQNTNTQNNDDIDEYTLSHHFTMEQENEKSKTKIKQEPPI